MVGELRDSKQAGTVSYLSAFDGNMVAAGGGKTES